MPRKGRLLGSCRREAAVHERDPGGEGGIGPPCAILPVSALLALPLPPVGEEAVGASASTRQGERALEVFVYLEYVFPRLLM